MVDPALAVLGKSMKSKSERIALDAARDVLDRNDQKGKQEIELSGEVAIHGARERLAEAIAKLARPESDPGHN